MDVAHLLRPCCFSPALSPPSRPLSHLPALLMRTRPTPFRPARRRRSCFACGADTLIAGSEGSSQAVPGTRAAAESGDLKSWLHLQGLPPCKVELKERPSHDGKHRPIHYVVASEDLQAGDVAFSVPNSLVVTLDRVLGNETIDG